MFMFLFLLFSVLLLCSFFKLKELFQVKNGLTTSLLENAKNLGRSDDAKRRKKRGWPNRRKRNQTQSLEDSFHFATLGEIKSTFLFVS